MFTLDNTLNKKLDDTTPYLSELDPLDRANLLPLGVVDHRDLVALVLLGQKSDWNIGINDIFVNHVEAPGSTGVSIDEGTVRRRLAPSDAVMEVEDVGVSHGRSVSEGAAAPMKILDQGCGISGTSKSTSGLRLRPRPSVFDLSWAEGTTPGPKE